MQSIIHLDTINIKAGVAESPTLVETCSIISPIPKNTKFLHQLGQHIGQPQFGKKPDILGIFITKIPSNLY